MSLMDRCVSAAAHRSRSGLKHASFLLGFLTLCTLAPAVFLSSKEGSALPPARTAQVSFAGLDLSTPDGARDARERIRKAARDLCARNLQQRSLDWCVHDTMAAAQQEIRTRTAAVSLADLDLSTPQGVRAAHERLQAAAQRGCQELQTGGDDALSHYSACVDETLANAVRQADLLQRISVDF